MTYRNRSQRCSHGFARELVRCPVCDALPQGYRRGYIPTEARHHVINKRSAGGRARNHRAHGYTAEPGRTSRE